MDFSRREMGPGEVGQRVKAGMGSRKGGKTKRCHIPRSVQGLLLGRLTGQMSLVLKERGRSLGPTTASGISIRCSSPPHECCSLLRELQWPRGAILAPPC